MIGGPRGGGGTKMPECPCASMPESQRAGVPECQRQRAKVPKHRSARAKLARPGLPIPACPQLNFIVVEDVATGQRCLEMLRANDVGRCTVIVLEKQQHLHAKAQARVDTPENVSRCGRGRSWPGFWR